MDRQTVETEEDSHTAPRPVQTGDPVPYHLLRNPLDLQQERNACTDPREKPVATPKAKIFSRIPLRRKSDTTEEDAAHPLAKMKQYDPEKAKQQKDKLKQHHREMYAKEIAELATLENMKASIEETLKQMESHPVGAAERKGRNELYGRAQRLEGAINEQKQVRSYSLLTWYPVPFAVNQPRLGRMMSPEEKPGFWIFSTCHGLTYQTIQ